MRTNCPLGRFFKGNFNCSAGLAQWCGLAQTLAYTCTCTLDTINPLLSPRTFEGGGGCLMEVGGSYLRGQSCLI